MKKQNLPRCAVLLAGGRGTRFWPRSRTRTPKQLLNITGPDTMIRQTADRLHPLFSPKNIWVVTNDEQTAAIRRELPKISKGHIVAEPVGRNTAAAIGLAAIHLAEEYGEALMAVLPADHHIAKPEKYKKIVAAALALASEPGNLVVMGVPPDHPETGFGYIELAQVSARANGMPAYLVRRFTEKPVLAMAKKYLGLGAVFLERGDVLLARVHLSGMPEALSSRNAFCSIGTCLGDRYSPLRRGTAPHLSNARKHFRRLRGDGTRHQRTWKKRSKSAGIACRCWMERHRLVGCSARSFGRIAARKRVSCAAFHSRRKRQLLLESQ